MYKLLTTRTGCAKLIQLGRQSDKYYFGGCDRNLTRLVGSGYICVKQNQFTKQCDESHHYGPQVRDHVYAEVPGGEEKAH
jgi:hypothetical protein